MNEDAKLVLNIEPKRQQGKEAKTLVHVPNLQVTA